VGFTARTFPVIRISHTLTRLTTVAATSSKKVNNRYQLFAITAVVVFKSAYNLITTQGRNLGGFYSESLNIRQKVLSCVKERLLNSVLSLKKN
jgi:hypothetical protein